VAQRHTTIHGKVHQEWSTVIGLAAGTYTVTVTDDNGCTVQTSVEITEPAILEIPSITGTDPSCYGLTDGSITISVSGGTEPYSYVWSNGSGVQNPAGLGAGTYTVTVTDGNNCTAQASVTLGQPAQLILEVTALTNTTCNASVGSVTLAEASTATGTFTLDGQSQAGVTSATFTGLSAGYYTAYFTDEDGCTTSVNFNIITTDSDLTADVSVEDPLCNGGLVTATVTASDGAEPYTYELIGVATNTSGEFTDLGAGNYNVLVTDTDGCTFFLSFDIDEPTVLLATMLTPVDVSCNGLSDGEATVVVTGGTTPYDYSWEGSSGGRHLYGNSYR